MLVEIDKVIVNDRIRKDFGNIDELAQDIKENGLINPPVVTPEFDLIAGERRYRAMKSLGWQQIEVRVMSVQDALHKLKLEISENENRKDFSFNEKMTWAEMLKDEYSKIAKENQLSGLNNQSIVSQNSDIREKGRTDDLVAKEVGFGSRDTYRKAQYIYENADEEMIKQLDEGKLSINKAFVTLKEKAKRLEEEKKQLKLRADMLEQDKQRLSSELQREKNKPVKVEYKEKIIDNTDYTLKSKLDIATSNLTKLKNDAESYKEKYIATLNDLKEEQSKVNIILNGKDDFKLISNSSEVKIKINEFLTSMSEYGFIATALNELPDAIRRDYIRTFYSGYKWFYEILSQVRHDDIIDVNYEIIEDIKFEEVM